MSINPSRLPYIAQMAPCLFEYTDKDIGSSPNKTEEMHYIADMFKELVDIAYPMEDEENMQYADIDEIIKDTIRTVLELEDSFNDIGKIMKNYKTPKKEGGF